MHPLRDYKTKRSSKQGAECLVWKCSPRLTELFVTVREWTKTKRGQEEKRDRGGNPLSAKLCSAGMFGRLFAHVTWLATAQRTVWQTEGGRARGSREKVRWIWWEVDGWRTRKVAQVIADHFSCFCNFMLCAHVRIGRCGCMRCICSRYTILKCRCFPSTFRVEMMINWLFSHPDKLTCS